MSRMSLYMSCGNSRARGKRIQKKKPQEAAWNRTVSATRPASSLHSVLVRGRTRHGGARLMLLSYRGSSLYVCGRGCHAAAAAAEAWDASVSARPPPAWQKEAL